MRTVIATILMVASVATANATPTTLSQLKEGLFLCEGKEENLVKLTVNRHPTKWNKIVINWEGRDRILHNEVSVSGALRYEGAISKLLYLQMPSHSVLLDNNTMRPILLECKLSKPK